jgi:hypothetical protein
MSLTLEDVNNLGQIVGHATLLNYATYAVLEVPILLTPSP